MQVGITTSLQSDNSYMISAEKIEKTKITQLIMGSELTKIFG